MEKYKNGPRFVRRTEKLANEFGISLSDAELEQAHELRSELAYAQSFLYDLHHVLPADKQPPLYNKLVRNFKKGSVELSLRVGNKETYM